MVGLAIRVSSKDREAIIADSLLRHSACHVRHKSVVEPSANAREGPSGVVECGGAFVPGAAIECDAGRNALSERDAVPVLRACHDVQGARDEGCGDLESCVDPVCLRGQRGSEAMPLRESESLQFCNRRFEDRPRLDVISLSDQSESQHH